jgi:small subunit ribosomal protein S1
MPASHIDTSRVIDLSAWIGREIEAYVLEFNIDQRRAVISRRLLIQEDLDKRRSALLNSLKLGEIRQVCVKSILDFGAFVDMGPIDGFIPREEISYERGSHPSMFLQGGQEVKVKVIKVDGETGKITLSRKQARVDPWIKVDEKYPANAVITGRVVSITNFGAFVQIEEGITGMIHVSNLSWDKGAKRPEYFMKEGDIVKAVVLELDKENRKMALGLKQITEDPWIEVEGKYNPGMRVKGIVTQLTEFGAFIKLDDNLEGLVYISNLTWDKKPEKPNKYLKVGQEIEAIILKTDREGRRISLGYKQLQKSPWDFFFDTHRLGDIVPGVVTRLTSFGAFVDLGEGVEGLLHVSQISTERVDNPNMVLKEGQNIRCKIIKIASGARRISLSRKDVIMEEEKKALAEFLKDEVKGGVNVGDLLKDIKLKFK